MNCQHNNPRSSSGSHANGLHQAAISRTGIIIVAALVRLEKSNQHNSKKGANRYCGNSRE